LSAQIFVQFESFSKPPRILINGSSFKCYTQLKGFYRIQLSDIDPELLENETPWKQVFDQFEGGDTSAALTALSCAPPNSLLPTTLSTSLYYIIGGKVDGKGKWMGVAHYKK